MLKSMSREINLPSSANAHDEYAPLLQDSGGLRPYQPYCVTEASSRPQSPDPLVSKPLRVIPVRKPTSIPTTPDRALQQVDVNTVPNTSTTTTLNKSHEIEALGTGSKSNIRLSTTNRKPLSRDTRLVDPNHIARAVTPRGSHLLAPGIKILHDETPSLRMQPIKNVEVSPDRILRRKSLRPSAQAVGNGEQVRLLSTIADQGGEYNSKDLEKRRDLDEDIGSVTVVKPNDALSTGAYADESTPPTVPLHSFDAHGIRLPPSNFFSPDDPAIAPQSAIVLPSPNLDLPQISPTPRSPDPNRSPHATSLRHYNTQFPSSEADYTPRGLPSETKEGWAHRRTEPKDAKLRYQFGRRPSINLDIPPPTPPHRSFDRKPASNYFPSAPATNYTPSVAAPPPASQPSHDSQAGPRPPPWISFETLEAQRRQRGDARERADAALLRSTKSSTSSLHQNALAGDGTGYGKRPLRNEVEEYRVAVLNVYPDMEFDGEAGKGGRECCCCVM